MYVDFSELPPQSRLWIYQAQERLTEEQIEHLGKIISAFLENWQAHGKDLRASFQILHERFLLIGLDESCQATGCSIDQSIILLKNIAQKTNINFLDRWLCVQDSEQNIQLIPLLKAKEAVRHGAISKESLVFDTNISQKSDLANWLKPAHQTWLAKYF